MLNGLSPPCSPADVGHSGKLWQFTPCNFREGQSIAPGSIFGSVYENELMPVHAIMCPPKVYGTVTKVYGASTDGHEEFTLEDPVRCEAAVTRACLCGLTSGVWAPGHVCRCWKWSTQCLASE